MAGKEKKEQKKVLTRARHYDDRISNQFQRCSDIKIEMAANKKSGAVVVRHRASG